MSRPQQPLLHESGIATNPLNFTGLFGVPITYLRLMDVRNCTSTESVIVVKLTQVLDFYFFTTTPLTVTSDAATNVFTATGGWGRLWNHQLC